MATALLIAVMVLAACGNDTGSDTSEPSGASPATTASTQAAVPSTTAPGDEAPQLAGTRWNVTEYTLPNGSLANLWPGTEITLEFPTADALTGSGGCNQYQASYAVSGGYDPFEDGVRDPNDGQAMRVVALSFTERACAEPSNVMEQEAEYFAALAEVGRWVIVRGSLALRDADGFILIFAEPAD